MDKNYFLGSVGRVEAFRVVNGQKMLAFVSSTMTDTGLNTSISADDIRGGQGAPVITRFYHDASVEITLTDVMFKKGYVESQLGAEFEETGEAFITETHAVSNGSVTLDHTPISIGFGCEADQVVVWYAKEGSNDWTLVSEGISGKQISGLADGTYCFRYLAEGISGASAAKIYAGFVPEELYLVITTPLYAGDACAASNGAIAGEVQYVIPRFRLNGGQDFAANMSSNQQTNLSGVALGTDSGCDDGKGKMLYKMIVKLNNDKLSDHYDALEVLDESLVAGATPIVYGIDSAKKATLIANSLLKFTPALVAGKFGAAGSYTIADPQAEAALTKTVTVAAE